MTRRARLAWFTLGLREHAAGVTGRTFPDPDSIAARCWLLGFCSPSWGKP